MWSTYLARRVTSHLGSLYYAASLRYPVTHNDIEFLKSKADEESTRDALDELVETDDTYDQQVVNKRLSLLDLLSKYRDINISLEDFLRRLQPMRARQVCPKGCSVLNCHLQTDRLSTQSRLRPYIYLTCSV